MREIKFRAWDTDTNEYIDCYKHTIGQMSNTYAGMGSRYIYDQYTGLTDKNGVEIYEGDILGRANGHIGKVFWRNEFSCWEFIFKGNGDHSGYMLPLFNVASDSTIFGNIYQNTDLLK